MQPNKVEILMGCKIFGNIKPNAVSLLFNASLFIFNSDPFQWPNSNSFNLLSYVHNKISKTKRKKIMLQITVFLFD